MVLKWNLCGVLMQKEGGCGLGDSCDGRHLALPFGGTLCLAGYNFQRSGESVGSAGGAGMNPCQRVVSHETKN